MFSEKSAKVLIVESSGAVRQLIADVFRGHGYKNIQNASNPKDALALLETEPVDWVVANLLEKEEVDTLKLLALLTQHPELRSVRFSLILNKEEMEVLPSSYEKGLFCHFVKPFNRDSLNKELEKFQENMAAAAQNHTKFSAQYLRSYLAESGEFKAQISLERALLDLFPADIDLLCRLATAQKGAGEIDAGKATLAKAALLGEKCKKQVDELAQELFGTTDLRIANGSAGSISLLDLKHCVIVDEDSSAVASLKQSLGILGVEKFTEFSDGQAAWEFISNLSPKELSLIIQEWRIPKLTGPLLLQRIRKDFACTPILCISKDIGEQDLPLIKEMGLNSVLKKPLNLEELTQSIVAVIQQDRLPTEADGMENRIRQLLESGQYEEAVKLNQQYQANSDVEKGRKSGVDAEFAYYEKDYSRAQQLCLTAIRSQRDSLILLNLLGKILMQQKSFDAALKCFEKAQALSPMNVKRLCDIASVASESDDHDKAKLAINAAEKIDAGNAQVSETKIDMAISQGNSNDAKAIMEGLASISNVISHLNNKAVSLALSGKTAEGIALYQKTLESIPESKPLTMVAVAYNLALAYVRSDKIDDAISTLTSIASASSQTRLTQKVESLLDRLKKAKAKGEKIALKMAKTEDSSQTTEGSGAGKKIDHLAILASIEASAGDICCFKVFANPLPVSEKAKSLFLPLTRFNRRVAIERAVAGGVEKTLKTS